jgi:hypothetical protein
MRRPSHKPECYMCPSPATSREHVPPRNLFPEAKDVDDQAYRVNLITVPSRDAHNSAKSRDDEFLMVSLAGIIGNNSIGYRHRFGKVDRAIRASANHLLAQALRDPKPIGKVEIAANQFAEIIWGTPDVARLTRCFEHIAYGLHRHHFSARFAGRLFVHLGYLVRTEHNPATWDQFVRDRAALDLAEQPKVGANPQVFYYQVTESDQFGYYLMRLHLYGGLQVLVAFQPAGVADAAHIGTALIGTGVRTVFTLGARTYEFNPGA